MTVPKKKQTKLGADDLIAAESILTAAESLIIPDDQSQRTAFGRLMPHLYVLRNKGCSWSQLAELLGQCGFKLQPSVVRNYYGEMLADRLDVCQARMNDQIEMLDVIARETKGADLSVIARRTSQILARQKAIAAPKIASIFGAKDQASGTLAFKTVNEVTTPLKSDQAVDSSAVASNFGEFGLLQVDQKHETKKRHDDRPFAFVVDGENSLKYCQTSSDSDRTYKCMPLQVGVIELKRRNNVPDVVYEQGFLEHPAIPGLMLSRNERLYGTALDYIDIKTGEMRTETLEQKRFRITWRKPIPLTETRTQESFTKMDESLFPSINK